MASQLEELPVFVLSLIFAQLAQSPKALHNVALVSRACYAAAVPFLYRDLKMHISSRQDLKDEVEQLETGSLRSQFLLHARSVKIWGRMPLLADEQDGANRESFDPEELAREMGYSEEYDAEFGDVFVRDVPDGPAEEVAEAWAPLALWIQNCTHLTDLIWVSRNQLPPCLLEALHHHHPACRLHMRSFRLRSLAGPVTDPHELDLIRSPCLYSISVKTVTSDSDGHIDYNGSAILQVAALAPNLSHLNLISPRTASSAALRRALRGPLEPWKGFVPPLEINQKGSLATLSYFGRRGMSVKDLGEWPKYVDMSKIRCLILGDVSDPLVFRFLTHNFNIGSLELVDFGLSPMSLDRVDSLVSEVEMLIEYLEPLKELRLEGYLTSSIFDKVLQQHGPKLRRLTLKPHATDGRSNIQSLIPAISSKEIQKIEAHCPLLEYLSIWIPNTAEIAQTKFGLSDVCPKLRHLRELELAVDFELSGTLMDEAARKIWDRIDIEKGGFPINTLHLLGSSSIIVLKRNEGGGRSCVEASVFSAEIEGYNLEIMRKFHGLPTTEFR